MKLLMTMMIHQLSVTSNKVSSQLISPQNWPVFIFPLTQSEPDIYHLNSNQSLKKFPVVLTCTYFSFYLSCGPRGIFYYLESITWSFHNHMCLLHYSRLNSSYRKDRYDMVYFRIKHGYLLHRKLYILTGWSAEFFFLQHNSKRIPMENRCGIKFSTLPQARLGITFLL